MNKLVDLRTNPSGPNHLLMGETINAVCTSMRPPMGLGDLIRFEKTGQIMTGDPIGADVYTLLHEITEWQSYRGIMARLGPRALTVYPNWNNPVGLIIDMHELGMPKINPYGFFYYMSVIKEIINQELLPVHVRVSLGSWFTPLGGIDLGTIGELTECVRSGVNPLPAIFYLLWENHDSSVFNNPNPVYLYPRPYVEDWKFHVFHLPWNMIDTEDTTFMWFGKICRNLKNIEQYHVGVILHPYGETLV